MSIFIWVFDLTPYVTLMPSKLGPTVVLSILAGLLLSFSVLRFTEAQLVDVGVEVGDWVKYGNISVTWDSEEIEPDPEVAGLNSTLWYRNDVYDIVDTTIFFRQTSQYKNGTPHTAGFHLDLYNGIGNDTYMFTAAKLRVDDLLYPALTEPLWVNETIHRFSAGAIREVNYLKLSGTQIAEEDPLRFLQISINYYWDRATGVLTLREGAGLYTEASGRQIAAWTRSEELIDTNLWSPDSNASNGGGNGPGTAPYAIAGVAATSVVLVGAWFLWRRKKRFKRRKTRARR